jgi:hypothetical protein
MDLNNPYAYGKQPLQVSAGFQEQYPYYHNCRLPGDRQQFHPANRPNYSQDYRPSSIEYQQSI